MSDDRKRWTNEDGLEFIEPDPRRNDPNISYGIKEPEYDFDKPLYTLTYDPDLSKILINRIIIKGFQNKNLEVEQIFIDLFDKLKDANKYKTKFDHDFVTEMGVKVKANQASAVMNNIKIPKDLRSIMFSTSSTGEMLYVQTVVTKKIAIKNSLDVEVTNDFFNDILRKNPKSRVPRTF